MKGIEQCLHALANSREFLIKTQSYITDINADVACLQEMLEEQAQDVERQMRLREEVVVAKNKEIADLKAQIDSSKDRCLWCRACNYAAKRWVSGSQRHDVQGNFSPKRQPNIRNS